jgi:putative endonuclease
MSEARLRAHAFGLDGESWAALALRLKGYRVLARRAKHHVGEVDLIARRGGTLAFIEVKARRDAAAAIHAITPRQRRRIEQAALAYMQKNPALAALQLRFDVVLVTPRSWPRHVVDAWRPDSD